MGLRSVRTLGLKGRSMGPRGVNGTQGPPRSPISQVLVGLRVVDGSQDPTKPTVEQVT